MDKIERRQTVYFESNYVGLVISFVLGCLAMCLQDAKWLMNPAFLRIVLHAVAALAGTFVAYFTTAWFMSWVTQKLLEPWFLIVTKGKKRNIKKLWLCIIAFRPMISAAIYIAFAIGWETLQAEEFHRTVQMGQLITDVIFAILGGICLYNLSNYSAVFVEEYRKSDIRDIRRSYREDLAEWDDKYKDGGKLLNAIYVLGIPILTFALNVFAIWITFKFIHH